MMFFGEGSFILSVQFYVENSVVILIQHISVMGIRTSRQHSLYSVRTFVDCH